MRLEPVAKLEAESFNPEPAATATPRRRRWLRVKQLGRADG